MPLRCPNNRQRPTVSFLSYSLVLRPFVSIKRPSSHQWALLYPKSNNCSDWLVQGHNPAQQPSDTNGKLSLCPKKHLLRLHSKRLTCSGQSPIPSRQPSGRVQRPTSYSFLRPSPSRTSWLSGKVRRHPADYPMSQVGLLVVAALVAEAVLAAGAALALEFVFAVAELAFASGPAP